VKLEPPEKSNGPTDVERLAAVSGAFAHDVSNVSSGLAAVVYLLEEEKNRLSPPAQQALGQLQHCVDRLFEMHATLQPYRQIRDVPLEVVKVGEVFAALGFDPPSGGMPSGLRTTRVEIERRWIKQAHPWLSSCDSETLSLHVTETHLVLLISGPGHEQLDVAETLRRAVVREFFKWMGGSLLPEQRGWRIELRLAEAG